MNRKNRLRFGIGILVVVFTSAWAGFPFSMSPVIEGVITDSNTHKPVEKAIVIVQWYRNVLISDGPGAKKLGSPLIVATDEIGHYQIPAHFWFTPWGKAGCSIAIGHPFYLSDGDVPIYASNFKRFKKDRQHNGKLHFNSALHSLEDFYENRPRSEKWINRMVPGFDYFLAARKLRMPIEKEIIVERWERLAANHPAAKLEIRYKIKRLDEILKMNAHDVNQFNVR